MANREESDSEAVLEDILAELLSMDPFDLQTGVHNNALNRFLAVAERALAVGESLAAHQVLSILNGIDGDVPFYNRKKATEHAHRAACLGDVSAMFNFSNSVGIWDHEALALLTAAVGAGCDLHSFAGDYRRCMRELTADEHRAVLARAKQISDDVQAKGRRFKGY